jgi:hypothetical protein
MMSLRIAAHHELASHALDQGNQDAHRAAASFLAREARFWFLRDQIHRFRDASRRSHPRISHQASPAKRVGREAGNPNEVAFSHFSL